MKTNKVIASALAFIMATTVAAGSVFAAGETVTISATTAEAKVGDAFSVDVMLSDIPATGIMGCEFALSYDASALTISGVEAGAIAGTGADSAESDISGECPAFYADFSTAGTITLTWSTGLTDNSYWITDEGVFATITGTVNTGTAGGTYPISITAISRDDISGTNGDIFVGYIDSDNNSVEYTANTADGAVIVCSEVVTTTTTTVTTTETKPTETTTTTTQTSGSTTAGPAPDVLIGDVNLDGSVSLVDVVYLNKGLAGSVQLNAQQKINAECVSDGAVGAADATALLKYCVESIDSLPVIP